MTEDVLLSAILRREALRVVDDERDHTVGRNTRSGLQVTRCYLKRRRGVSALSLDGTRYLGWTLAGLEVRWVSHALRGHGRPNVPTSSVTI